MCGIVGIVSPDPVADRQRLVPMRDVMTHRGPDDEGEWWSADGRVGFGHRRLSIIDLSARGRQPMCDGTGQVHVLLNGEIYNFQDIRRDLEKLGTRFRTATDTEVLLEAYRVYGVDCLSRLNGQFAFGLFDESTWTLVLARDRAGEKPLFYRQSADGAIVFASELKALMADSTWNPVLDIDALQSFLAYGYVPGEQCILRGVRKLPQGHVLTMRLDSGTTRCWSYWSLPDPPDPIDDVAGEDLEAELEVLLEQSVRRQLIADVPVGILLSGGVDSSLITAMAARAGTGSLRTYTISFPGHPGFDEGPFAKLVALPYTASML